MASTKENHLEVQIKSLYEALNNRDVNQVHRLLAPHLDWWFHGPHGHMHLMRLLTGSPLPSSPSSSSLVSLASSSSSSSSSSPYNHPFIFSPLSIVAIGSTVLVEGYNRDHGVSWVHAWTVDSNNVIVQVKEYFNTSVTVTVFENAELSSIKPKSCCKNIWQSKVTDSTGKSMPGLILAL